MFDRTAQERFEDTLDFLDAAVEDLVLEADIAPSSGAKVKAISARVAVFKERQQMLDEAGLLPRWAPRPIEQGVNFATAIADILKRNDVPHAVIYECVDVVAAWTDDRHLRPRPQ